MSLYIFLLYHIYHLCFTCIDFYDLSAFGGCWFDVYIRRFIYKFLNVCPFDYTAVAGSGKVRPVNQVNHTSWVAVVTPIDRPKSVRYRCLIELFCSVVYVVTLPFWHFRGCKGFCHRTESDLLLFVFKRRQVNFSSRSDWLWQGTHRRPNLFLQRLRNPVYLAQVCIGNDRAVTNTVFTKSPDFIVRGFIFYILVRYHQICFCHDVNVNIQ